MVDRTQEDITQDRRIDALERAQRVSDSKPPPATARLDKLEKDMAELKATLAPYDNIVKFIKELRWRGVLPHIEGF